MSASRLLLIDSEMKTSIVNVYWVTRDEVARQNTIQLTYYRNSVILSVYGVLYSILDNWHERVHSTSLIYLNWVPVCV